MEHDRWHWFADGVVLGVLGVLIGAGIAGSSTDALHAVRILTRGSFADDERRSGRAAMGESIMGSQ